MAIRIGTSGWVYNHWRGLFYPEGLRQKDWFRYYAGKFDTVEINNTFYRLPQPATFIEWRNKAPSGFLYAVKASRFLTHMTKLKDPEAPLDKFFRAASNMGPALGPVLYQLPPYWQVDVQRFEYFLSVLPNGYQHVVEFRNATWLTEKVFRLLERYHVAHCIHDMHQMPIPLRVTAFPAYIRLHGAPTDGGNYQLDALEQWAKFIDGLSSKDLDVFVYFNNDIGGHAPENALTLKRLLHLPGENQVPGPT